MNLTISRRRTEHLIPIFPHVAIEWPVSTGIYITELIGGLDHRLVSGLSLIDLEGDSLPGAGSCEKRQKGWGQQKYTILNCF